MTDYKKFYTSDEFLRNLKSAEYGLINNSYDVKYALNGLSDYLEKIDDGSMSEENKKITMIHSLVKSIIALDNKEINSVDAITNIIDDFDNAQHHDEKVAELKKLNRK